MKKFPLDCSFKCPHYHSYDLSIDDWTCVCDKLNVQIDECDTDFKWMFCPLDNNEVKTNE